MGRLGPPPKELPALDDTEGWKSYVAETDGFVRSMVGDAAASFAGSVDERDLGPCPLYVVTPDGIADDDPRVFLDIHGGAWVLGGGDLCKRTTIASASAIGVRAWSVDYRMPPDHPFPTPLDDCLTAYRLLLDERHPGEIIVGGTSAGGNLAAALILRARDEGLPLPAAVVFNTGAFDLTGSGDSWQVNDGLDNVLSGPVEPCTLLYAGSHDRREPYLSPLFGDLTGFPPVILLTGTPRPAALGQRAYASGSAGGRGRGRAPRLGGGRPRRIPRHGPRGCRALWRAAALCRDALGRTGFAVTDA